MAEQLTVSVVGSVLGDGEPFYEDLTDLLSAVRMSWRAFGGADQATVEISDSPSRIDAWLERGIPRQVTIYDPALCAIWQGFVTQVDANVGGRSLMLGPLTEVGNRVAVNYAPVDVALTVPATGISTMTTWGDAADSQARYGTWEKLLTAGGRDPGEVDYLRDTYLADNALPKSSYRVASGGVISTLTLTCAGWYRLLEAFIYTEESSGYIDLSDKIAAVLDADPNGLLSSANADIESNALTVPAYDNSGRTGLAVIQSLLGLGNAADVRTLFRVDAGRRAVYETAPMEVGYLVYQAEAPGMWTTQYAPVQPWGVRPGRWLLDPDFLVGRAPGEGGFRGDPRYVFIEEVSFDAPYGVSINGTQLDTISQRLAQITMSGGQT